MHQGDLDLDGATLTVSFPSSPDFRRASTRPEMHTTKRDKMTKIGGKEIEPMTSHHRELLDLSPPAMLQDGKKIKSRQ